MFVTTRCSVVYFHRLSGNSRCLPYCSLTERLLTLLRMSVTAEKVIFLLKRKRKRAEHRNRHNYAFTDSNKIDFIRLLYASHLFH